MTRDRQVDRDNRSVTTMVDEWVLGIPGDEVS